MKSTGFMRIGELAERFGLAPHVLRHWEAMGLLTPAARENGRRRYTHDHIIRVITILRAKEGGMSLDRIRAMLNTPDHSERRSLLQHQHAELEERLAAIQKSKALIEHIMECTAEDFTQCPGYLRIAEGAAEIKPRSNRCLVNPDQRIPTT